MPTESRVGDPADYIDAGTWRHQVVDPDGRPREVSRGYGKSDSWGGKYLYGAFSSLVASYVVGYEHFHDLHTLNNWRSDAHAADRVVAAIRKRYETMRPDEVMRLVERANRGEIRDIYSPRLNSIQTARENLDFMENVMANYKGAEQHQIDKTRMDDHHDATGPRTTLEPVSERWQRDDAKSFEAELHRGAYANPFNIAQNTIAADLVGYLAGDRAFETDVLDSSDKVAVISHEFALNQQTGQHHQPAHMVSQMTANQITALHYGVTDPDASLPNARRSPFNILRLEDKIAFHDRYLPGASLSLDARNMSSITSIMTLKAHYDGHKEGVQGTPAGRPGATSVKIYPFTLAHGYEQALVEFTARRRPHPDLKFEDVKFWRPPHYAPEATPEAHRTREEIGMVGPGGGRPNLAAMPVPTDEDRAAFAAALKQTPLTLAVGGVMAGDPRTDTASPPHDLATPFSEGELAGRMQHQGSDSVLRAINLRMSGPNAAWMQHAPYGCAATPSHAEQALIDRHGVAAFTPEEKRYIQYGTLKTLGWIATFAPHANDKCTVQFQAQPALTEIRKEADAVRSLAQSAAAPHVAPEYLALADMNHSSLRTRSQLLESAVIDNVHQLFGSIGRGETQLEVYDIEGEAHPAAAVQSFFKTVKLSGFDRFSDFSISSRETGEMTHYVYDVVKGEMKLQMRGSANQTGATSHSLEAVSSATTDLPVEKKLMSFDRALHRVDEQPLPSHRHVTVSQRSVLVREGSAAEPQPRGLTWGQYEGRMPTREEAAQAIAHVRREAGADPLRRYAVDEHAQSSSEANRRAAVAEVARLRSRAAEHTI